MPECHVHIHVRVISAAHPITKHLDHAKRHDTCLITNKGP
jgi:hypothetical protein